MANNNSYDKFKVALKQNLKDVDVGLECSVNLDSVENVVKILAVEVDACTGVVEALNGEASVSGNVLVNLVYLTEQGEAMSASYTSPYLAKVVDGCITTGSKVFVHVKSCEGEVKSLVSNVAKVDCALKLACFQIKNEEVDYLNRADENVCYKEEECVYECLDGVCTSNFVETLDVVVKDKVNRVVASTCDVSIKNVELEEKFMAVSFEAQAKVMYLTDGEDKVLKTAYFKQNFRQEIECEYATKDSKAETHLTVNKCELKTTLEEVDDELKIVIEMPCEVCALVFSKGCVNLITDLYSTRNLTTLTSKSYESTEVCEPIVFEKKIEGSLTLSEDEARIDKLLAVNYAKAIVLNSYIENGEYTVSGVVNSNLIYFSDDEGVPSSVDVQIPFMVSTEVEYAEDSLVNVVVKVTDVDVMVKKGRDIYVDAILKVRATVCKKVTGVVVSELEYLEEVAPKDCAIEIYFAKAGESVWDIAKKLYIKPEVVFNQNPEITEVLEHDQKLAIYYKKTSK